MDTGNSGYPLNFVTCSTDSGHEMQMTHKGNEIVLLSVFSEFESWSDILKAL